MMKRWEFTLPVDLRHPPSIPGNAWPEVMSLRTDPQGDLIDLFFTMKFTSLHRFLLHLRFYFSAHNEYLPFIYTKTCES